MSSRSASGRAGELAATRAFFAPRAAGWEDRFPDDDPLFAAAVGELAPRSGGVALDLACGTGRALGWLRDAVGPAGVVVGIDVTPEMLAEAARRGRGASAALILADAALLPVRTGSCDALFAAGLLPHLHDPAAGLAELARVSRPGARLALFHPLGRVALAERRGHQPDPADVREPARIRALLAATGWDCISIDDSAARYLVIAVRVDARAAG